MTEPMIKTDHLSHTYEDEDGKVVYALKDISLEIGKGEFVAIIGTNGSGKSTLAKHFNVLLTPTSGTCEVCGMRTDDPDNIWKIRQHVGMVFQNPITRSSPPSSKKTWPLARKTSASRRTRSRPASAMPCAAST